MSQRDETAEKLLQLKEQLGPSGGNASGLLDGGDSTDESDGPTTASGSADLPEIGESIGRSLGGLAGRKVGEVLGREFDHNERMVALLTSYLETTDLEDAAESLVSSSDDTEDGDDANESDGDTAELPDELDGLSTDELQSLADRLMDELEERSEDG